MLFNNSRISILQNKKKENILKHTGTYSFILQKREEIYGLDNCLQINRINCLLQKICLF